MKVSPGALISALIFIAEAQAVLSRSGHDFCHVAIEAHTAPWMPHYAEPGTPPAVAVVGTVSEVAVPMESEKGTGNLRYTGPPWVTRANMIDCQPNVWCVLHDRGNEMLPPSRPFSIDYPLRFFGDRRTNENSHKADWIQCYTCGDLKELEDDAEIDVRVIHADGFKDNLHLSILPSSTKAAMPIRKEDVSTAYVQKGPAGVKCVLISLKSAENHVRSEEFSMRKPLRPQFMDADYLECYR